MAAPLAFRCASCGAFNRLSLLVTGREAICGKCKQTLDVSGHPTPLTAQTFDGAVESSPVPILVDFWAPWCGPCRAMAPVLEELGRAMAGKIVVAKLNVDEAPGPAQAYGVQGIPTLILFRGGREVERIVGARPLPELLRAVEQGAMSVSLS